MKAPPGIHRARVVAMAVVLIAGACSSKTASTTIPPPTPGAASSVVTTSATPASTTKPGTVTTTTGLSTTVEPDATSVPVSESVALNCGSTRQPEDDLTVVLDAVALPASPRYLTALQAAVQPGNDPAGRLFAKTGIRYRAGNAAEIIVPEELRDRLSIGWEMGRSWHIVVPPCPERTGEWLGAPGGYWFADPLCATLIVRSQGQEQRVEIGLGTPCPGQGAAPQPTST
jgi:hypothetical protein